MHAHRVPIPNRPHPALVLIGGQNVAFKQFGKPKPLSAVCKVIHAHAPFSNGSDTTLSRKMQVPARPPLLLECRSQAAKVLSGALWSPCPASRPATEMSSSSASQCRPRLLIRTCSRCSGVLCRSRGNHASGTPITLPSLRSTHMLSASKCTRVALTEEFIPCPFDEAFVLPDDLQQFSKHAGVVTIIVGY